MKLMSWNTTTKCFWSSISFTLQTVQILKFLGVPQYLPDSILNLRHPLHNVVKIEVTLCIIFGFDGAVQFQFGIAMYIIFP